MEINAVFESYIILNDEEFKCEIHCEGSLENDYFTHEYGYKRQNYIDNIYINSITNLENNEVIEFNELNKKQKKELIELSYEYLNDSLDNEQEEFYG